MFVKVLNRLCVFILLGFVVCINSNSILPLDLSIEAKKHNCEPVTDFFDRLGVIEAPYAYGYLDSNKESSAVFWCRSNLKKNIYKLVVYIKSGKSFGCENEIETINYPGGLSIVEAKINRSNKFYYLKDGKPFLGILGKRRVIRNYYDGGESSYYCHEDEWIIQYKH